MASRLDNAARAYAMLLSDPCNGPLAKPLYSGGEGGYLIRGDTLMQLGNTATQTAGYFNWTPAATTSGGHAMVGNSQTSWTSATNVAAYFTGGSPALTFLASSTSAVRVVAACLRIIFPGSESARSGWIAYGQTSGALVKAGAAVTPANFAQTLPYMQRTPPTEVELIWRPNDADQTWQEMPSSGAYNAENYEKGALGFAFGGLPDGVGIAVHLTAVYEWQPAVSQGIPNAPSAGARSSNTVRDVLNYLYDSGFEFVRGASGVVSARQAGMLAASYGLMASRQARRQPMRIEL